MLNKQSVSQIDIRKTLRGNYRKKTEKSFFHFPDLFDRENCSTEFMSVLAFHSERCDSDTFVWLSLELHAAVINVILAYTEYKRLSKAP